MTARASIRRWARILLIGVGVCLAIPIGIAGFLIATFDANEWKPRLVDAVRQATGRDLSLNGPIGLTMSLVPSIRARDVALSNPPGFSRAAMVTLERLEIEVALLPLLSRHVEIRRLVLVKPDIRLERDANGTPNWAFTPEAKPASVSAAGSASPKAPAQPVGFGFQDVRIQDGTLAYRDAVTGSVRLVTIPMANAHVASFASPMHVSAEAVSDGTPVRVVADVGSLARLLDKTAESPWPVQLAVDVAGASLTARGQILRPLQGSGYDLSIGASMPDLAGLARLLGRDDLPSVRDIVVRAAIADQGTTLPRVTDLSLRLGRGDLSRLRPGLIIDSLDIASASLDQPIHIRLVALGLTVDAVGTVARVGENGFAVKGLRLSSADGDIAGDVFVDLSTPPNVVADIRGERLDLDALLGRLPTTPPVVAPGPSNPAPPAAPAAPRSDRLIPDRPIPFGLLQLFNADLRLRIGTLRAGDAEYRALDGHLTLRDGVLTLDPFAADVFGGRVELRANLDAAVPAPPVSVFVHAPKLALRPLLAAFGQPRVADGDMELYADLRGVGETPHAIAASLQGHLSLALAKATIDNKQFGALLGRAAGKSDVLNLIARGGANDVRCFALRANFDQGIGTLQTLALASSLLTMRGGGSVDLGAETVALRITPRGRMGSSGFVVPLKIAGPIRGPSIAVDVTEGQGGGLAGIIIGNAAQLNAAGAFGDPATGADVCAGALATARGDTVMPATTEAAPPPPSTQKPPNAAALLRQLLR